MEIDRPASGWRGAFDSFFHPVSFGLLFCLILPLSACQTAAPAPTAVRPEVNAGSPTAAATVISNLEPLAPGESPSGITDEPPPLSTPIEFPALTATALPFGSCTDGLTFLGDLTYPDRTKVHPGERIEKSWKVRNSGECDWGPEYRFRWGAGTHLTGQDEFALYPASAGSEAAIVIPMIAPSAPGEYSSDWRAVSPLGVPFGDTLYIDIIVAG